MKGKSPILFIVMSIAMVVGAVINNNTLIPSYPLAVRTPYLSTWLPAGRHGGFLAGALPQFWTGEPLRWTAIIRVDGESYLLMGNPGIANLPFVQQTGVEYTASATFFYSVAGSVNITTTFLSPITPKDLLRQSLPFSYFEVSFQPTDGKPHQVQIYTDIDAAWAARDTTQKVTWEYIKANNQQELSLFSVSLSDPVQYGEFQQMSQYGNAYYGTLQPSTVQCGPAKEVIAEFMQNGKLNGDIATPPVLLPNAPVVALSISFDSSTSIQSGLFGIGHIRNPVVLFNNSIPQYHYLSKEFNSSLDAFQFFLQDYENVTILSRQFDAQLVTDAASISMISSDYVDLVSLSARQAFAGIEFATDKSGKDTVVYLKEISSDGNVNTVDVIMPSIPIWLYTNPSILGYMLLPLLRYQDNGKYPHQWAMHDLGTHYPNAAGHPLGDDEPMPIEESGNMILMALVHSRATSDTNTILEPYYHLFRQWANYLVNSTLIPGFQLATTDAAGPLANQTNLAVKGIIALQAMAQIANLTNHPDDAVYYQRIAELYVPQWVNMSLGSDQKHIKLAYQLDDSWGIQFNLFMDTLLNLKVVPDHVYQLLDTWYLAVANEFGVQLDTRVDWGKTDWNMWCAATSSETTRNMILSTTMAYIHEGDSQGPLPDRYNTTTGLAVGGIRARCSLLVVIEAAVRANIERLI